MVILMCVRICVCVSLYSWRTRGHGSLVGPGNEHIIQSQNLLPQTASCPGFPRQGPSLPHAHPLLHFQEGQLSSDLYFDPLGGGAELGKEEE